MKKILFIHLFFIFILNILSQPIDISKFTSYSTFDGLSNITIRCITQDKYGFIWIGTTNGLNRFDGIQFDHFFTDSTIVGSLPSNYIQRVFLDNDSILWISTNLGFCRFNYETEKFYTYKPDSTNPNSISSNEVLGFLDEGKEIILCTTNGINIFNKKNQTFKTFHTKTNTSKFSRNVIHEIKKDEQGKIWFSTWGEGLILATRTKQGFDFEHFYFDSITKSQYQDINAIMSFDRDKDGNFWLGTYGGGIIVFDPIHKREIRRFVNKNNDYTSISHNNIKILYIDRSNRVWAGTDGDMLNCYDNHNDIFYHINNDLTIKRGYRGYSCLSIFQSKDGTLWFGGRQGLNKYYNEELDIINFHFPKPKYTIKNNSDAIKSLAFNFNGNILCCSEVSLFEIDINKNSISTFNIKYIDKFDRDLDKTIWFTKRDSTIFKYVPDEKKTYSYPSILNTIKIIYSFCIHNSILYIYGVNNNDDIGLYSFNINNQLLEKVWISNYKDFEKFKKVKILYDINTNSIWFSNILDIIQYNIDKKIINKLTIDSIYDNLFEITCFKIFKDSLIIGTNKGILFYNLQKSSTRFYPITNLFTDLSVLSIEKDSKGNIWFSTEKAISLFNHSTKKYIHFNSREYFNNESFNYNSSLQDKQGYLYFGGGLGLTKFLPSSFNIDTNTYPLIISEFKIFNKKISSGKYFEHSISETNIIKLSYKEKIFSFRFVLMNYTKPDKINYAYYMDGIDNEWNFTKDNLVNFSLLPPGKYTLFLKAFTENGIVSESKPLTIIITPPFWQTLWFKLFSILMFILVVISYNRYRNYKIRELNEELKIRVRERTIEILEQKEELKSQNEQIEIQNHELEKLNSTKDRLFSIIAHDLKNPFNAISGFTSLIINNYNDYNDEKKKELLIIIKESADDAFRLFENLLNWSRANLKQVKYNPQVIVIDIIIKETIDLLSLIARKKGVKLLTDRNNFEVYADKDMIATVIRNIIANAIKFTEEDGEVKIITKTENNYIKITISDNGIGITDEIKNKLFKVNQHITTRGTQGETGTGIGLILCKEFIEKNNGEIFVESELGKGSSFIIKIPAKK